MAYPLLINMKKKMILKVVIDLDKQEYGVTEATVSSNTNVKELKLGPEFVALVFEGLAKRYRQKGFN